MSGRLSLRAGESDRAAAVAGCPAGADAGARGGGGAVMISMLPICTLEPGGDAGGGLVGAGGGLVGARGFGMVTPACRNWPASASAMWLGGVVAARAGSGMVCAAACLGAGGTGRTGAVDNAESRSHAARAGGDTGGARAAGAGAAGGCTGGSPAAQADSTAAATGGDTGCGLSSAMITGRVGPHAICRGVRAARTPPFGASATSWSKYPRRLRNTHRQLVVGVPGDHVGVAPPPRRRHL